MSGIGDLGGVDLRPARMVIADVEVWAPNQVDVVHNGLDIGPSVGHLRIIHPHKGKMVWVPIVRDQARALGNKLLALADDADADTPQEV